MAAMITAHITEDSSGHLMCDACNSLWCQHISFYITSNSDHQGLWQRIDEHTQSDGVDLGLPIDVPVDGDANLFFHLTGQKFRADSISIGFGKVDPVEWEFIGYLNRGEGRLTLTEMLDNWIFQFDFASMRCLNPKHSFAAQQLWERTMKNPDGRRLQYYSIIMERRCWGCRSAASADDFSDLIPEDTKRPNPFGKS